MVCRDGIWQCVPGCTCRGPPDRADADEPNAPQQECPTDDANIVTHVAGDGNHDSVQDALVRGVPNSPQQETTNDEAKMVAGSLTNVGDFFAPAAGDSHANTAAPCSPELEGLAARKAAAPWHKPRAPYLRADQRIQCASSAQLQATSSWPHNTCHLADRQPSLR